MAKKKPLVITNGQVEQLQSGDRLDLSNSTAKTNGETVNMQKGAPVYVTGGNARLAQADAQSTVRVVGMADALTLAGDPMEVVTDGIFTATTGEWDLVTGQTGGLTEGAQYFLSAGTAGMMTTVAPTVDGEFVVPIGYAVSSTEFELQIGYPIKL
jgi:hypothetical protein